MKPIKRALSLRKETIRHLADDQLRGLAGGNVDAPGPVSAYQCGTLISCAACTELQCILNTSVITSCR